MLAGVASAAAVPVVRKRLARASASAPTKLEDMTKDELDARAQAEEIPGRSTMSKEQLVDALRAKS